jgi:hypothetical protein
MPHQYVVDLSIINYEVIGKLLLCKERMVSREMLLAFTISNGRLQITNDEISSVKGNKIVVG